MAGNGKAKKAEQVRRARVVLSLKHMLQLTEGQTLTIRLHNVAGEEQLLDLVPAQAAAPLKPKDRKVFDEFSNIMGQFSKLMDRL